MGGWGFVAEVGRPKAGAAPRQSDVGPRAPRSASPSPHTHFAHHKPNQTATKTNQKPPADKDAASTLQTLLFSATMPAWVKDITRRFLRKGHKLVDLVGDSKIKAGLGLFWGGFLGF
jgi:hypothetical protein